MSFGFASVRNSLIVLLCAGSLLTAGYVYNKFASDSQMPELKELASVSWDYDHYKEYFVNLTKNKGSFYAFSVLKVATLARGIDSHQIGHEIGHVLYAQKGIAGLGECKQYLNDACPHALVMDEFIAQGANALKSIAIGCSSWPPNSGMYVDCFHGMGHGILAYSGYDYKKATEECKTAYDVVIVKHPDAILEDVWGECVGGVTMEMLRGSHDRGQWEKMKLVYLPDSDVMMPCDAPFMSPEVLPYCYTYTKTRLLTAAGVRKGVDFPKQEVYEKVFEGCESIPAEQLASRRACYGGVGVHFVYSLNDEDIRLVEKMTPEQMRQIHDWCAIAKNEDGESACVLTGLEVVFSSGEYGFNPAITYCSVSPSSVFKDRCFHLLVAEGRRYLSLVNLDSLCLSIPDAYRHECISGDGVWDLYTGIPKKK